MTIRPDLIALYPAMLKYGTYLCHNRDDGADLAHDGIVQALIYERSFQPGTNLKAWVFRLMKNIFINKRLRPQIFVPYDDAIHDVAVDHMGEIKDQARRALNAIAELTQDHRSTIIPLILGDSYEDIAKQTLAQIGTVRSRVSRARERIIELIETGTAFAFQNNTMEAA